MLARALDHWWDEAGRPEVFRVFDAGTGPGTLVTALRRAEGPSSTARVVAGFDRSPDPSAHGGGTHDSGSGIAVGGSGPPTEVLEQLDGAVVVANELLDNLAFRQVERTVDGWADVFVDLPIVPSSRPGAGAGAGFGGGAGDPDQPTGVRPTEVLLPADPASLPSAVTSLDVPVGTRVPVLDEARRWVTAVTEAGARLVVFDYGAPTTAELAARGGWLRTYRRHERGDDPYREPGSWDITTDVALDQLPSPTSVGSQAEFLRRWGIDDLVAEGRARWQAAAAAPDVAAMVMRSRINEAEALLDPAGLGSWLVAEWQS